MTTTISRDPFARHDTVREVYNRDWPHAKGCDWCGNWRYRKGIPSVGSLFAYGTLTDGGRLSWHKGGFCSKSCHDSYHS